MRQNSKSRGQDARLGVTLQVVEKVPIPGVRFLISVQ